MTFYRSGPSREGVRVTNPDGPAMVRVIEGWRAMAPVGAVARMRVANPLNAPEALGARPEALRQTSGTASPTASLVRRYDPRAK
jgi:hypothetical protein